MQLNATVIEISQMEGYATVRFQLSGNQDMTTGDCFSVAVNSADGYEVGQTYLLTGALT